MDAEQLRTLDPNKVPPRALTADEVVHMATVLGAWWRYDYEAAENGRVGLHAELKSGLHSDGFFASKILLEPDNICKIIANQIVMRLIEILPDDVPDYVAGIPKGATKLGEMISETIGAKLAKMEKDEASGRINLVTEIPDRATLLLVEDFCTRGTGFKEAVMEVTKKNRSVDILPYDPVIINRGGLETIYINPLNPLWKYKVLPVVNWRVQDWRAATCPLCKRGSEAIKPKATDENWLKITTSQLPQQT